jgi:hypothetical protein
MLPSGLLLEQARISLDRESSVRTGKVLSSGARKTKLFGYMMYSSLHPRAIMPLWTFPELRESDRYPKVNTPFRCDWRILVISHPLTGNIKIERW